MVVTLGHISHICGNSKRKLKRRGAARGANRSREILRNIESGRFMDIFRDKAPLVDYLRALPVYVIINSSAELRAGAVHATAMCARP
jgi:hypothetical protein